VGGRGKCRKIECVGYELFMEEEALWQFFACGVNFKLTTLMSEFVMENYALDRASFRQYSLPHRYPLVFDG
jgi:hypothetical protein